MKHFKLTDFSKDNYRYYEEQPDKNFSAKRNYAIINQTIKDYEKMRYTLDPKVKQNAENVSDILASFAKYKLDIGGGKKLEQWLGKEWISRIYGEKLLEKIKQREAIRKINIKRNNTKFLDYYLK